MLDRIDGWGSYQWLRLQRFGFFGGFFGSVGRTSDKNNRRWFLFVIEKFMLVRSVSYFQLVNPRKLGGAGFSTSPLMLKA